MKIKTSITLSDDVLAAIDELAGAGGSRSAVIERVLRNHLARRARALARTGELVALNRQADRLNAEAADVVEYQVTGEIPAPVPAEAGIRGNDNSSSSSPNDTPCSSSPRRWGSSL